MARGRPKTTRTVTVEQHDADEPQEERDISGILKSLSPTGKWIIKVFRMTNTGQQQWLGNRSPEEISEQMIAEQYGEGRYLVRPWDEVESKWGPSKIVHISAEADGVKPVTPFTLPNGDGSNVQLEMMKLQMQMEQQASERQFTLMQQFNTSMMNILTAIIGAQKPQDLASIVSIVKDMNGSGSNISTLKDIVGLAKELAPGSSADADPMTSLFTSMVPKLLDRGAPPAAMPAAPLPPQHHIEIPPADASKPTAETTDARLQFLAQLKDKARAGKDPEFWADYIEENAEEAGPAWILATVKRFPWDQVAAGLVQIDADLAIETYRNWFQQLYNALTSEPEEPAAAAAAVK